MVHQHYTRTDARTTYDSNTALALRALHGKELIVFIVDLSYIYDIATYLKNISINKQQLHRKTGMPNG